MEGEVIDSVFGLTKLLKEINITKGDIILFRGQIEKGNLIPKIARPNPSLDTSQKEKAMLQELKRRQYLYRELQVIDDWSLLVIAQHFGMATRLLDWTSNPLIALWFACAGENGSDLGHLYTLIPEVEWVLDKVRYPNPFDNARRTLVFKPTLDNKRILAQGGWFTAHAYSRQTRRWIGLEKNARINKSLFEFVVDRSKRASILDELNLFGINHETVYPDVVGACKYMNWLNI